MRYSDKIGRKIRSIREAKGYSQEYMAEMLEMAQSSYANLESGKSNLHIDRLLHICEILQIDVHQFFDDVALATSASSLAASSGQTEDVRKGQVSDVYEQLIDRLKSEIEFLRGLVRNERT